MTDPIPLVVQGNGTLSIEDEFPVGSRVRVNGDPVLATVVPRPPARYVFIRFDGEPEHVRTPMSRDEIEKVGVVSAASFSCCEVCDRNPTCGVDCGSCEGTEYNTLLVCDVCGEEDSDERIYGKVEVCRSCLASAEYRIEQLTHILQRFIDGGRLEELLCACDNAGIRPGTTRRKNR